MTGVVFLCAFASLPLLGAGLVGDRRFDWMPGFARVSVSAAVGAVILCGEMLVLALLGVRWSVPLLLVLPIALAAGILHRRRAEIRIRTAVSWRGTATPTAVFFFLVSAAALAFVTFAAMTARITSSDLLLFWGTKGEHFGLAGSIDAAFLGEVNHRFLNVDYPPLWSCLYAYGTLLAGRFAWGAALATLPFFLLLGMIFVWSLGCTHVGSADASAFAALFVSMFGLLQAGSLTAGNADAALLLFEAIALGLLVFARDMPGAVLLSGVVLAGASLLKIEGIAFASALIASYVLVVRPIRWRQFWALAAPPFAAVAAWFLFCRTHGLVDFLAGGKPLVLTSERFGVVFRGMWSAARFGSAYVPWIVVILLIVGRKTARAGAIAIITAALILVFDVGVYFTTEADPTQWIVWSAPRTLMTPLLALYMAGSTPARSKAASTAATSWTA